MHKRLILAIISMITLSSCNGPDGVKLIILPSITKNMKISKSLTYSAFAVLNNTSAHLGFMSPNLSPNPQLLKTYSNDKDFKNYYITLDKSYRSLKGETFNADDLIYTIKLFLSQYPEVSAPFKFLIGHNKCKEIECEIKGIKKIDSHTVKLTLNKSNDKFVFSLLNPWFIIFKKGKPHYESIGDCIVPYQTGQAIVIECKNNEIKLKFSNRTVVVTNDDKKVNEYSKSQVAKLINDNPGVPPSPTLTILTVFANPKGFSGDSEVRKYVMRSLRENSKQLAEELKLIWAPLQVSQWMKVKYKKRIIEALDVRCPDRPIKFLLDTSLPNLNTLKNYIKEQIDCDITFKVTTADKYFYNFERSDLGIAWFTPDEKSIYNFYSCFDCADNGLCYFDWNNDKLQKFITELRINNSNNKLAKSFIPEIEKILYEHEYSVPLAEMNWWIKTQSNVKSVHPSGLAQIKISDFLDINEEN